MEVFDKMVRLMGILACVIATGSESRSSSALHWAEEERENWVIREKEGK